MIFQGGASGKEFFFSYHCRPHRRARTFTTRIRGEMDKKKKNINKQIASYEIVRRNITRATRGFFFTVYTEQRYYYGHCTRIIFISPGFMVLYNIIVLVARHTRTVIIYYFLVVRRLRNVMFSTKKKKNF